MDEIMQLMTASWQLTTPLSAICFDCDGTLSALEGINELARYNHVTEAVEVLTAQAMSVSGINPDIYTQRLNMVNPTLSQLKQLADDYYLHRAPDIEKVLAIFHRLNKTLFLLSAGMNPAVKLFGERLGFAAKNIFAVDLTFDTNEQYVAYDATSPLIYNQGKRDILSQLCDDHSPLLHIGDGLNDLIAKDLVTRFVGYGGIFYRDNIAEQCQFYIRTPSLAALLPLALTKDECKQLTSEEWKVYQHGLEAILEEHVKV